MPFLMIVLKKLHLRTRADLCFYIRYFLQIHDQTKQLHIPYPQPQTINHKISVSPRNISGAGQEQYL